MLKAQAKPIFRLLLTFYFVFSCFCFAGEQEPQYDNLSFGVPGKADTIIERPGYALGYIEYHEQPAWGIYIMTKAEATTKVAKRTNKFRSDPEILQHPIAAAPQNKGKKKSGEEISSTGLGLVSFLHNTSIELMFFRTRLSRQGYYALKSKF